MEQKKTPHADLENERTTFFLLGFTVVLSLLFIALEWSGNEKSILAWDGQLPVVIENEYAYNEPPIAPPADAEVRPETAEPVAPKVVYEDYTVVEEAPVVPPLDSLEAVVEPVVELPPPPSAAAAEPVAVSPDAMPQYPGGYTAMNRYLFERLKYPASALSQKIEGRVWCSFIVAETGALTDIQVERSVYLSLDQEAVRVLQAMPAWIPGTVRGFPARVKVYLPIVFKL
jgi:protein TonB